tara:strand:+ start:3192 stop:4088 length:897 start_codon:yes stop_codon:yes gene_type:complete
MQRVSSKNLLGKSAAACLFFALNTAFPLVCSTGWAQNGVNAPPSADASGNALAYADLADLASAAPLIINAEISQAISLKPEQSAGVPAGFRRAYITAKTEGLIRGDGGVAPNLSYLYDVAVNARGKMPKLKKQRVLLFARAGTRPGEIQLVAPDAQIPATPSNESTVRSIVAELLSAKAAPKILGLGDAFYVAGTVEGEGETQIFLRTDSGDPVSLSIVRRPGVEPRWAVALGEIVDEAAATPKPGTLLWYRLACALPPALTPQSVRTLSVPDAEAARADYKIVLAGLGPCGRTRTVR